MAEEINPNLSDAEVAIDARLAERHERRLAGQVFGNGGQAGGSAVST